MLNFTAYSYTDSLLIFTLNAANFTIIVLFVRLPTSIKDTANESTLQSRKRTKDSSKRKNYLRKIQ